MGDMCPGKLAGQWIHICINIDAAFTRYSSDVVDADPMLLQFYICLECDAQQVTNSPFSPLVSFLQAHSFGTGTVK